MLIWFGVGGCIKSGLLIQMRFHVGTGKFNNHVHFTQSLPRCQMVSFANNGIAKQKEI